MVTKLLSSVDIGEVDFDDGDVCGADGVAKCDAGVGICGSVEDDSVKGFAGRLDPSDEFAFEVALAELDFGVELGGAAFHQGFDIVQGGVAVDLGLACAEEVQIWAIEEEDFHGGRLGLEDQIWDPGAEVEFGGMAEEVEAETGRPTKIPSRVKAGQARAGM